MLRQIRSGLRPAPGGPEEQLIGRSRFTQRAGLVGMDAQGFILEQFLQRIPIGRRLPAFAIFGQVGPGQQQIAVGAGHHLVKQPGLLLAQLRFHAQQAAHLLAEEGIGAFDGGENAFRQAQHCQGIHPHAARFHQAHDADGGTRFVRTLLLNGDRARQPIPFLEKTCIAGGRGAGEGFTARQGYEQEIEGAAQPGFTGSCQTVEKAQAFQQILQPEGPLFEAHFLLPVATGARTTSADPGGVEPPLRR